MRIHYHRGKRTLCGLPTKRTRKDTQLKTRTTCRTCRKCLRAEARSR